MKFIKSVKSFLSFSETNEQQLNFVYIDWPALPDMRYIANIVFLTTVAFATSKNIIILINGSETNMHFANFTKKSGPKLYDEVKKQRSRAGNEAYFKRMKPRNASLEGFDFGRDSRKPPKRNRYILQWTVPYRTPFNQYMLPGNKSFVKKNCSFTNCFVTSSQLNMRNITYYDVIVFNGPELYKMKHVKRLPKIRESKQKYIFNSRESSHYYPIKCPQNFFNWTWTYRLDSDVPNAYIIVRDSKNNVIGPSADVKWMSQAEMDPITVELKEKLKSKKKAAAWIVSNCNARSMRQEFAKKLQKELRKYRLLLDIYGHCWGLACSVGHSMCMQMIKEEYYFYLAFENSFSADYVTEKLLLALQNSAVPVVLGTADYSRFMPPGIYLDALELGPKKLAARMHELISRPEEYQDMFRWRNHYSYHVADEVPDTDPLCQLCQMINDVKLMSKSTGHENFGRWWVLGGEGTKKRKNNPTLSLPSIKKETEFK